MKGRKSKNKGQQSIFEKEEINEITLSYKLSGKLLEKEEKIG